VSAKLGTVGYDAAYHLAWGQDLIRGHGMFVAHASTPTPHPLLLGWGALLAGVTPGRAAAATLATCGVFLIVAVAGLALTAASLAGGERWPATAFAGVLALLSPAMALLTLEASLDVVFLALVVWSVLASLHGRYGTSVALLATSALLRPEALLLLTVPAALARARGHRGILPVVGVVAVIVCLAWLGVGALAGDPLFALNSATSNAMLNDNPRGPAHALTSVLPALAVGFGWPVTAAAFASVALLVTHERGRVAARARSWRTSRTARLPAPPEGLAGVWVVAAFVCLDALAYLAQGLLGTPLVARYLLAGSALCLPLAAALPRALAALQQRSQRAPRGARRDQLRRQDSRLVPGVALAALAGVTLLVTADGWRQLQHGTQTRGITFAQAEELLSKPILDSCRDITVRSPAMIPWTALRLELPLSTLAVGDAPRSEGVLLQPRTLDAALLSGYGPITPLAAQQQVAQGFSPRGSNQSWALYSNCTR
jgi:hypothetical protein